MKLITTGTSPYGRKIRILFHLLGLREEQNYQIVNIVPRPRPPELTKHNVLSKVPTLVLADGTSVLDSQLITEYLLNTYDDHSVLKLIPDEAAQKLRVKNLTQMAQGLIEYTICAVLESRRPRQHQYDEWIDLMNSDMRRILTHLEEKAVPEGNTLDLYSLTLICALDFIDFRVPAFNWKKDCARLHQWHTQISQQEIIKQTYPRE